MCWERSIGRKSELLGLETPGAGYPTRRFCLLNGTLYDHTSNRSTAVSSYTSVSVYQRVAQAAQGTTCEVTEVIIVALEAALPPLPESLPSGVAAAVVRWAWLEDEALRAVAEAFLPRQQQRRCTILAHKEETERVIMRERAEWEQFQQAYLRLSQNKAMVQFILTQHAQRRAAERAGV